MCSLPRPGSCISAEICPDDIPNITRYANGRTGPTPKGPLGFKPGELVGSGSGALGLRSFAEELGHELILTADKDAPNSEFEKLCLMRTWSSRSLSGPRI
jgi:formate dehydrogenase